MKNRRKDDTQLIFDGFDVPQAMGHSAKPSDRSDSRIHVNSKRDMCNDISLNRWLQSVYKAIKAIIRYILNKIKTANILWNRWKEGR